MFWRFWPMYELNSERLKTYESACTILIQMWALIMAWTQRIGHIQLHGHNLSTGVGKPPHSTSSWLQTIWLVKAFFKCLTWPVRTSIMGRSFSIVPLCCLMPDKWRPKCHLFSRTAQWDEFLKNSNKYCPQKPNWTYRMSKCKLWKVIRLWEWEKALDKIL